MRKRHEVFLALVGCLSIVACASLPSSQQYTKAGYPHAGVDRDFERGVVQHELHMDKVRCRMERGFYKLSRQEQQDHEYRCLLEYGWIPVASD